MWISVCYDFVYWCRVVVLLYLLIDGVVGCCGEGCICGGLWEVFGCFVVFIVLFYRLGMLCIVTHAL